MDEQDAQSAAPGGGARAVVALALAALGAALLGVQARWVAGAEPGLAVAFELRAFGARLGQLDAAGARELAALLGGWPRWALAGLAALGAALGAGRARAWLGLSARATPGLALGLFATAFFALDPGLPAFVLARQPASALGYLDVSHAAHALGLCALFFAGLAGLPRASVSAPAGGSSRGFASRPALALSLLAAGLLVALLPEWIEARALGSGPLTNDGRAYLFQAELFRRGAFALELGPLAEFFPGRQILPGPAAYSKYPPGHSVALALGLQLGHPLLLARLLGLLLPALAFDLGRRAGAARPLLGAWLFSLSPMLLATQSLWLSHATSLPLSVVALWAAAVGLDRLRAGAGAWGWVALAAAAASGVGLARPGTGLVLGACLAAALASAGPRAVARLLPVALAAAAPAALLFFWHAFASTGDALLPPYVQYAREVSPNDRWGLVNLPTAWTNTSFNLARLHAWGLGLGAGLLWPLVGWLRGGLRYRALLAAPAAGLLAFHALLRFHGVPWAGPLYLVEGQVGLALLAAHGLAGLPRRGVAPLALALAALGAGLALREQFAAAGDEQALRRAPERAVAAWLAEHAAQVGDGARVLLLVPLEDETARRRYHLAPPAGLLERGGGPGPAGGAGPGAALEWPVLARDPGRREAAEALGRALGATWLLRFERQGGRCESLGPLASDSAPVSR